MMGSLMDRKVSDKTYSTPYGELLRRPCMAFFNSAVGVLRTLVVALGAGLGIWGAINLLEGRWTSSGRPFSADRSGA